jgi:hypothetical protein
MTLSTDVYIVDKVDPFEVFRFCQTLLTKYDDPRHMPPDEQKIRNKQDTSYTGTPGVWEAQPDNPWSLDNAADQGLPAWLMTAYRPDGPLRAETAGHDEDCDDDCTGKYHDRACWMKVDFDTAYSYRDVRGWGCGDLHAAIVAELGAWLTSRSVRWEWRNEFTGEIHDNPEALAELISGGADAAAWLRQMASEGGGSLHVGGAVLAVPDLRPGGTS